MIGSSNFHRLLIAGAVAALTGVVGMGFGVPPAGRAAPDQSTADFAITWSKTPKGTSIQAGTVVRYVVTVTNRGPDIAGDATLDLGFVTERAEIFSGAVSDGARCTKEDVVPGLAFFVHCSLGTLAAGASKSATLQLRALREAKKQGGAILLATLNASSTNAVDPDDSNSSFLYLPGDPIQYSIVGSYGGGTIEFVEVLGQNLYFTRYSIRYPSEGLNISRQRNATAMGVMTMGSSSTPRMKPTPRFCWLRIPFRRILSRTVMTVV